MAIANSTAEASSLGSLVGKIVNRWAWWQAALKGNFGPMHEGEAQDGYYRTRFKGGKWEPVAIWWDEDTGRQIAYRNGHEVDPGEAWNFCRTHPITFAAYERAVAGHPFDDEDQTVAEQVATDGRNDVHVDPAEQIKDQIEAALAGLAAYAKIESDEVASKALSLRNRLNELSNKADKVRTELKAPHLAAGKAVDEKWQPLVKKAKTGADSVRDAIGYWETKKLQEQRRREAEQAKLAAEQAARERQADLDLLDRPTAAPEPTPAPAAAPVGIKPAYGKAASVRAITVVKDVTDWPALAVYMSNHPECQDLLRKLAQRALDAGKTNVPGITTEEKAMVR